MEHQDSVGEGKLLPWAFSDEEKEEEEDEEVPHNLDFERELALEAARMIQVDVEEEDEEEEEDEYEFEWESDDSGYDSMMFDDEVEGMDREEENEDGPFLVVTSAIAPTPFSCGVS